MPEIARKKHRRIMLTANCPNIYTEDGTPIPEEVRATLRGLRPYAEGGEPVTVQGLEYRVWQIRRLSLVGELLHRSMMEQVAWFSRHLPPTRHLWFFIPEWECNLLPEEESVPELPSLARKA